MPDADQLKAYLADRDAPCPGCGYNLRGAQEPVCPECGFALVLRQFQSGLFLDLNAYCRLMYACHALLIVVGVVITASVIVSGWFVQGMVLGSPFVAAGCLSCVAVRAVRSKAIRHASDRVPRAELYATGCVTPLLVMVAAVLLLLILRAIG